MMDIYRMQKQAEDRMVGRKPMKFKMVGPLGEIEAEWLDPFFGIFQIPSHGDGFYMVKQFADVFPPIDFEWLPESASAEMG